MNKSIYDKSTSIVSKMVGRQKFTSLSSDHFEKILNLCQLKKTSKVLDIGSGNSQTAISLANKSNSYFTCLEPSKTLIIDAQQNVHANKLSHNFHLINDSFPSEEINKSKFSSILAIDTLCYFEDKIDTFKSINHLLEKSGYLVLSDIYLKQNFSKETLNSFLKNYQLKKPIYLNDYLNILSKSFSMIYHEDTTTFFLSHWDWVLRQIEEKEEALISKVGIKQVNIYKARANSLRKSVKNQSIGYHFGIFQMKH